MKKLLIIMVLVIGMIATMQAQSIFDGLIINATESKDTVITDTTINKICAERGHISCGVGTSTLIYCPPYLIETDSTTIMVYPAYNWISYTCLRCGKYIKERELERRIIIWQRKTEVIAQDTTNITGLGIITFDTSWNVIKLYDINISAKLLFEYETECYNDSTKWLVGLGDVYDTLPNNKIIKTYGYVYEYKHKEPTLKGFIKWLKTKN